MRNRERVTLAIGLALGMLIVGVVMVACPANGQEPPVEPPAPEVACLLNGNAQVEIVNGEDELAARLDELFIQCATILAVTSQKDGADTLYTVAYRIPKPE